MKYFTKEWYALCLKTFLAELLEDDDRAAKKDEEFYNELLKQRLGESLAIQDEIAKMSDEDIEIDIGEYEKDYLRALDERVRDLYSVLPEDISEEIADMRVFALNKATPEIHKRLRIYCNGAQKKVDDTLKAYEDYYNSVDIPAEIDDNLGFHDATIVSAATENGDMKLDFDISQSFATRSSVTLKGARIIEKEAEFEGCTWLYDELYLSDGGYELHIIASAPDLESLVYFTVFCENIIF